MNLSEVDINDIAEELHERDLITTVSIGREGGEEVTRKDLLSAEVIAHIMASMLDSGALYKCSCGSYHVHFLLPGETHGKEILH